MASIYVHLPNVTKVSTHVTPQTTVQEILDAIGFKDTNIVVLNEGETELPDLTRTMIDYNNWYIEKGYIPSIYIKQKDEDPK
jgi:hypothetical protein